VQTLNHLRHAATARTTGNCLIRCLIAANALAETLHLTPTWPNQKLQLGNLPLTTSATAFLDSLIP
jgi:hypothetical protein